MIAYGIGTLPLIKNLKQDIPDATQAWCADKAGSLGTFLRIETYFNSITYQGLGRGYYPEPPKSVLIANSDNLEAGKEFGTCHIFKVCMGTRYLGGYIRDDESKSNWLREGTLTREKNISTISKTAGKHTQNTYAVVIHAIQLEWIFL